MRSRTLLTRTNDSTIVPQAPAPAYSAEVRPVRRWITDFTMLESRRQNIRMNPATAANTEARGISVSGPRYNCLLSVVVEAAAFARRTSPADSPARRAVTPYPATVLRLRCRW
jgi:hypothetical protein